MVTNECLAYVHRGVVAAENRGEILCRRRGGWIGKNVYTVTIPDGNFFYAAALMKIV